MLGFKGKTRLKWDLQYRNRTPVKHLQRNCFCFAVNAYPEDVLSNLLFILTTTLSTDQLHIVASRTTVSLAVWVTGGECGSRLAAVALMSLSATTFVVLCSWNICLSLCYRVKELKRAREHESDRKSPLTMWYHSPDSSFLFRFYPRHFTSERWGKQKIPRSLRLLLLLQCYWLYYYYYMYNSKHFFTYLFFPLTWFRMESDNSYGIMNYKGVRVGVVGEGGCRTFASWHFLHFFMDFFGYKERDGRGDSRTCL